MRRLSAAGKDVKVGDKAENKKGEIYRMDNYITGAAIRALREKNRLTQQQLAEKLCVSHKTVSKCETGKGFPDISLIEPLADVLKISVPELLSGE